MSCLGIVLAIGLRPLQAPARERLEQRHRADKSGAKHRRCARHSETISPALALSGEVLLPVDRFAPARTLRPDEAVLAPDETR